MRDKLSQYVDLLFAGIQGAEDIRQEILQNSLDRYDDLVSQGKSPEAAYRLAISGIGDISEVLGSISVTDHTAKQPSPVSESHTSKDTPLKKLFRALAIGLYIISPLPLIILSDFGMEILGLCGTISIVAVATVLIILCKSSNESSNKDFIQPASPRKELAKSIQALISALGLVFYLMLSFATQAWYITWLVFPIVGAIKGLVKACVDLKEEAYEK